ncbi:MAG: hypothetical protein H0X65_04865 [Gemmatimonadetes bacterium]|nr:hypothetical protein [Gemmatimonadota bacterium]
MRGALKHSSTAGALLLRELMERLGYPALFNKHLRDPLSRRLELLQQVHDFPCGVVSFMTSGYADG